ncbi:MAG: alcohol dehydrogenase catalytic domain-containing protein [Sphingomicrobium sp.]
MTTKAIGWGTDASDQPLKVMHFERRDLRPDDVAIKITFAGICHSDLHTCRNDWGHRFVIDMATMGEAE